MIGFRRSFKSHECRNVTRPYSLSTFSLFRSQDLYITMNELSQGLDMVLGNLEAFWARKLDEKLN